MQHVSVDVVPGRASSSFRTMSGSIHGSNLINRIKILIENLVHGKHVHTILFENRPHRVVAANLPLISRVLQVARFDVFPDFLHSLGARELCFVEEGGEGGGEGHWFLFEMLAFSFISKILYNWGNERGSLLSDLGSSSRRRCLIRCRCRRHP
jgi:hypothetical protein